jgi:hypothetical protein
VRIYTHTPPCKIHSVCIQGISQGGVRVHRLVDAVRKATNGQSSNGCLGLSKDSLKQICNSVRDLEEAKNCKQWGEEQGPLLLQGSKMISGLTPHFAKGVTAYEYCVKLGGSRKATEAACNSVPSKDISAACKGYGVAKGVELLCLGLGFSKEDCVTAGKEALQLVLAGYKKAGISKPSVAQQCGALLQQQKMLCKELSDEVDGTCKEWVTQIGGNYFVGGHALNKFEKAVQNLDRGASTCIVLTDHRTKH